MMLVNFQKAVKSINAPGFDPKKAYIMLHKKGWGEHVLVMEGRVKNSDDIVWDDGVKYGLGDDMPVHLTLDFTYENAMLPKFFEYTLLRMHAEMNLHEVFEHFKINDKKLLDPHKTYRKEEYHHLLAAGIKKVINQKIYG